MSIPPGQPSNQGRWLSPYQFLPRDSKTAVFDVANHFIAAEHGRSRPDSKSALDLVLVAVDLLKRSMESSTVPSEKDALDKALEHLLDAEKAMNDAEDAWSVKTCSHGETVTEARKLFAAYELRFPPPHSGTI
jgi:hypothetical protein